MSGGTSSAREYPLLMQAFFPSERNGGSNSDVDQGSGQDTLQNPFDLFQLH
jgi:hypothetical protein